MEAKRAVKAFSLFDLGDVRPKGGGIDGDFRWFEDTWGKNMLEEHGAEWPATFACWAQRLLDIHEAADRAAFFVLMHNQSTRCVGAEVALVVP